MATLNKLVELLIPMIEPYVDDGETSAHAVLEAYIGRHERGPDEYCTRHVVLVPERNHHGRREHTSGDNWY